MFYFRLLKMRIFCKMPLYRYLYAVRKVLIQSVEVEELATRIGRLMKFWGLKGVHGRVWTLIYLSEFPLTSPAIMQSLQLSKSATNMALAELKQFDLIEFAGIEDTRHKLYRTNLSLDEVLARIFAQKNFSLVGEIKAAIEIVQNIADRKNSGLNQSRIKDLLQSSVVLSDSKVVAENLSQ